jgi:hypothetical protein
MKATSQACARRSLAVFGRRVAALLVVALGAALLAGSDCLTVRAAAEAGAALLPSTPKAVNAEPRSAQRVRARIRNVTATAWTTSTTAPDAAVLLVARAESSFLTADARWSGDPGNAPPEFFRMAQAASNDRASRAATGALSRPGLAPYAARLDQPLDVYLPANDFSDTGPGTVTASMSGLDVDALRSVAGGRVQWVTADDERGRVLVEARLSWLFEYLQTDSGATAFFAPGDKGIFAVQGLSYGSNWALVGYGVRWELAGGLSAYAHYDAQANQQQLFHIGSTGIAYAW